MNLLNISQRLEDAGVGIQGKSIFINMIPAESARGVLLRNDLRGTLIDHELPGYYRTSFRLIVRSDAYADGQDLITQAVEALRINLATQVGSQRFVYMRPRTLPVVFPLSKGSLLEFAVDIDVCFTE